MADLSHHDIGELSDVIRPLDSLEHLFWLNDQNRPVTASLREALCAALVNAGRRIPLGWQHVPVRILSPVNIRRVLGVGENCGVFISAASSVFDLGVSLFPSPAAAGEGAKV